MRNGLTEKDIDLICKLAKLDAQDIMHNAFERGVHGWEIFRIIQKLKEVEAPDGYVHQLKSLIEFLAYAETLSVIEDYLEDERPKDEFLSELRERLGQQAEPAA